MSNYIGIYHILSILPIWVMSFLLMISVLTAIPVIRDIFEGLGYQTANSARIGDVGLITTILIGMTILQRDGAYIPDMYLDVGRQMVMGIASILCGVTLSLWTNETRSGQTADKYHDYVVVPVILFLLFVLAPVIWYSAFWYEESFAIVAGIVWMALVVYDLKSGRFKQREWFARRGLPINGELLHVVTD